MKILVPIVHFFIFRLVNIVNAVEYLLAFSESLYKVLLFPGFETFRWGLGSWRAWNTMNIAYKKVPAYKQFINEHGGKPNVMLRNNMMPDFSCVPETDKATYIKQYTNEQRVKHGKLPRKGVMVDESSGSSGTPTSWVRGPRERAMTKQMLQLSYHSAMGDKQTFVINGFALGAWATGLNVSMSLIDIAIIKSTGPNLEKIVTTMQDFGPDYNYIIAGYPPFLKTLVDDPRINWNEYTVDAVFGGEGISEPLRTYLQKSFRRVVGSYGASDLEINMAAESPFTIALRKLIIEDKEVREALTHHEYGVTPMIFQYNPLAYMLETNKKGELVVTLCRPFNISPRIRYNIHDRGHVIRYALLKQKLKKLGKWRELQPYVDRKIDLPVLFLYGRSDMSVDYYGANVTPDSIQEVLYNTESIASALSTFRLFSYEDKKHNKRFEIAVELKEGAPVKGHNIKKLTEEIFTRLADKNRDFYNAYFHTATADNMPEVTLHAYDTGPFKGGQKKLKNEYVKSDIKYDKL